MSELNVDNVLPEKGIEKKNYIDIKIKKQISKYKLIVEKYHKISSKLIEVSNEINKLLLKVFNLDKIINSTNNEETFELKIKEKKELNEKIHTLREKRIELNSMLNKPLDGKVNLYTKYMYSINYLKLFDSSY
tara:strand:+ start:2478 stop:2876 length:399 start_codon:yes stop_codon:yes gene_type:complete